MSMLQYRHKSRASLQMVTITRTPVSVGQLEAVRDLVTRG
jgi:hypothetical protein